MDFSSHQFLVEALKSKKKVYSSEIPSVEDFEVNVSEEASDAPEEIGELFDKREIPTASTCIKPTNLLKDGLFEDLAGEYAILLLKYKGQDALKKNILVEGEGEMFLNQKGSLVLFMSTFIHGKEIPIQSNFGMKKRALSLNQPIFGLCCAFRTMRQDETAEFIVHPKFGYGELGTSIIPPNSTLFFVIKAVEFVPEESLSSTIYQPVHQLATLPKMEILRIVKYWLKRANNFAKSGDYEEAIHKYQFIMRLLKRMYYKEDEQQICIDLTEVHFTSACNLALCFYELKDYQRSMNNARFANQSILPNMIKPKLIMVQCLIALDRKEAALKVIRPLASSLPNNPYLKNLKKECIISMNPV